MSVQSVSQFFAQNSSRSKKNCPEKIKSDTDLSEGSNERETLFLQRVPTVAIYTLTAFTAQELVHQALATAQDLGVTNVPAIKDVVTSRENFTSKEATPIAAPELVA